jgi:hypothetical protein
MSKSGFEIADVFRAGFSDYCNKYGPLPKEHYSVANALMSCHTAIMGGHVYRCDSCCRTDSVFRFFRNAYT